MLFIHFFLQKNVQKERKFQEQRHPTLYFRDIILHDCKIKVFAGDAVNVLNLKINKHM